MLGGLQQEWLLSNLIHRAPLILVNDEILFHQLLVFGKYLLVAKLWLRLVPQRLLIDFLYLEWVIQAVVVEEVAIADALVIVSRPLHALIVKHLQFANL